MLFGLNTWQDCWVFWKTKNPIGDRPLHPFKGLDPCCLLQIIHKLGNVNGISIESFYFMNKFQQSHLWSAQLWTCCHHRPWLKIWKKELIYSHWKANKIRTWHFQPDAHVLGERTEKGYFWRSLWKQALPALKKRETAAVCIPSPDLRSREWGLNQLPPS